MAGPLPLNSVARAKVNPLLSIPKVDGSRRLVGNLSAPKGKSFNEGIPESSLKCWKVRQTTAKDFANLIARAGKGAIITCCDMVAAYKCLPVVRKQRRLQVFRFLGKEFVDLRLIMGEILTIKEQGRAVLPSSISRFPFRRKLGQTS